MAKHTNASGATQATKKFQARRSIVTEGRLRVMDAFGGNPIPNSDHHLMLEDLLHMSIRRHDRPFPMFKLQAQLLMELVDIEKTISSYKGKLKKLQETNASEDDIRFVNSELFLYRRIRYALRDIGDGIAWRFLEFDRCVLSQLGRHPRSPHINIEGMPQELHVLGESINQNDRVALLNDLTNILKKGDVTARKKDGSFEFVEVKTSNTKSPRLTRQKNDLIETVTFFNDEQKTVDGDVIQISMLRVRPESYMRSFARLLKRAEDECMIVDHIGEHLVLHVTDFTNIKTELDPTISFARRDELIKAWEAKGDFVLDHTSIDRHLHVQHYAPFSIFPIDFAQRVKLMTGGILVNVAVNVSAVLRYLTGRGWALVKGPSEFATDAQQNNLKEVPVAAVKKGPLTIHLPATIMGRMGHEFLSLRTLGDMLERLLESDRSAADGLLINFEDEASQWN